MKQDEEEDEAEDEDEDEDEDDHLGTIYDDNQVHFSQIHCLKKVVTDQRTDGPTNGPTNGPTDGQSRLQRCVDASKNRTKIKQMDSIRDRGLVERIKQKEQKSNYKIRNR